MDSIIKWLKGAIDWIWGVVKAVVGALVDLLRDVALWVFDGILSALGAIIEAIPVPAFLQNGLGGLFAGLDGSVAYFLGPLRLAEGLALLGVAVAFRLARKAVTLFQW